MVPAPDGLNPPGFDAAQIVVLSSIDWGAAWQRHQIFAAQFAAAGSEVFFVENTAFRGPRRGDMKRILGKAASLARPKRLRAPKGLPPGLKVIPPTVLPPAGALFRTVNGAVFIPRLLQDLARAGVRPGPVVIVYMPTATTIELARRLEPSMLVYDCASHFEAHPDAPPDFGALEKELLDIADLVVTDSPFLYELMKPKHRNVVRVHQGVPEAFLSAKPASGTWKSFCYYGTWGRDLDASLVNAVAREGFRVAFSGFVKGPPPPFDRSVERLKPVEREKIVTRVEAFEAFLMPYTVTPFHKGVIPAKLYECFAMGRPIIATPLPSLLGFEDLIYLADTPAEWARIARSLPETETPEKREARIRIAREHTHAREFERLTGKFRGAWASRRGAAPRNRGQAVTDTASSFLRNFSWIAVFFAGARAATLLVQFLAARALGPSDFGRAHLIYAVAAIIQILPMMGFPLAMSRFGASSDSEDQRARIVSTTLMVFAVWAASACLLLSWTAPSTVHFSGLGDDWTITLALAVFTAVELVVGGSLQGLCRFRERGYLEAIYGLTAFAVFAFALITGRPTHLTLIGSYLAGLGTATAYGIWQLRGHFRLAVDLGMVREILPFAGLGALNVLALALINAPGRIAMFRLHSAEGAGVYSAYYTATIQISLAILNMVHAVLVPLTSRPEGQRDAWTAVRRFAPAVFAASLIFFFAAASAALLSFGKKYPFSVEWLAVFAASAALLLMHGIASALFSARDLRGLMISVAGTLAAGTGNLVLNLLLTPRWGITGAGFSLLCGFGGGLAWYAWHRPRLEDS